MLNIYEHHDAITLSQGRLCYRFRKFDGERDLHAKSTGGDLFCIGDDSEGNICMYVRLNEGEFINSYIKCVNVYVVC